MTLVACGSDPDPSTSGSKDSTGGASAESIGGTSAEDGSGGASSGGSPASNTGGMSSDASGGQGGMMSMGGTSSGGSTGTGGTGGIADTDCVLTDWTAWSECSTDCGGGNQTRTRSVATPAEGNGAACSDVQSEERPCNEAICDCSTFTAEPAVCVAHSVCQYSDSTCILNCAGVAADAESCQAYGCVLAGAPGNKVCNSGQCIAQVTSESCTYTPGCTWVNELMACLPPSRMRARSPGPGERK